jgi:hypothetical protein
MNSVQALTSKALSQHDVFFIFVTKSAEQQVFQRDNPRSDAEFSLLKATGTVSERFRQ